MSYQVYIEGMRDHVQTEMLSEFTGKDGRKGKLINPETSRTPEPLPGQTKMKGV